MLHVNNEFGKLRKVLLASVETFHLHEPINLTQEYYYKNNPPVLDKLIEEQHVFVDLLTDYNVDVLWAEKRLDCTNQLNTRDVAFTIGNSFIVCPMKKDERKNEHYALENIISSFDPNDIVYRPSAGFIEGGDIILDGKKIFVGISQRTNEEGLAWLVNTFSETYSIIPIYLKPGFLHLDCVFNLLSHKYALVLKEGITERSLEILNCEYSLLFADLGEQDSLPTNVFSINSNTIVADRRNINTNKVIRNVGKTVIELDYSEISKIGGSFRCSTCPIYREDD